LAHRKRYKIQHLRIVKKYSDKIVREYPQKIIAL
jgi:hypothetical protein